LFVGLERHDDFLSALPVRSPLYVVVDLTRDARGVLTRYVSRQRGARRIASSSKASVYFIPLRPQQPHLLARLLEIHSIRTNDQASSAHFMTDNDAQTRWTTSRRQRGTERIVVDLGSVQTVGSVVLSLGPHRAEFPRELVIEVSSEGSGWQEAFRGPTAAQVMAAALEDHRVTPLRIDVGGRPARYLRLRLGSNDRRHYWSVTELEVWSSAGLSPASWAAPSAVLDPQARQWPAAWRSQNPQAR
jgi:F5/8 type C domain